MFAASSATAVISPCPDLQQPFIAPEYARGTQTPFFAEVGRYRLRMAQGIEDRDAACRLRFRVFNLELGEGLENSYRNGMDTDHFDLFCEHLIVEDKSADDAARRVVGTYRLQSGLTAQANLGYYSEQEFDFSPFEEIRPQVLELGRASIDREHRTPEVLTLLWRGIAQYATNHKLRYLIGCSSLNSREPADGWQLYKQLEPYRITGRFETRPTAKYSCPLSVPEFDAVVPGCKIPKLLRTYMVIGARIAAPPAWDREFGTIDFLTLLDLEQLSDAARNRFLAPLNP